MLESSSDRPPVTLQRSNLHDVLTSLNIPYRLLAAAAVPLRDAARRESDRYDVPMSLTSIGDRARGHAEVLPAQAEILSAVLGVKIFPGSCAWQPTKADSFRHRALERYRPSGPRVHFLNQVPPPWPQHDLEATAEILQASQTLIALRESVAFTAR